MTKTLVGRQVAVALDKAEAAIDAAVGEIASFAALLPEARQRAQLSAVSGQKVFEGASETLSLLSQARGRLVETHRRLEALSRAMNLSVQATGPVDKPDEDGPRDGGGIHAERLSA